VWLTRYLPLFVWIGVIFFLSSGQGSMSQTSRIIRPLLEFLFPSATPETILFYHGIIRKLAHLTEYAVLGFLACRAFAAFRRPFICAALLVLAVAAIDETNQSFNPARTGSQVDVLIDLSGGLVAIGLSWIWMRRRGAQRLSPKANKQ
jgi:VanZ family protein